LSRKNGGDLHDVRFHELAAAVVAKVEFHFGELFPRVGFIVTNLDTPSRAVVRFYNKRGTAEQWIKEGKQAVRMTRLSCHRFRSNQVLGQPVPSAGAAQANRELVADQLATAVGEGRRTAGQTCALLLATAGGRTSDAAAVRGDAGPDRAATDTDGIAS